MKWGFFWLLIALFAFSIFLFGCTKPQNNPAQTTDSNAVHAGKCISDGDCESGYCDLDANACHSLAEANTIFLEKSLDCTQGTYHVGVDEILSTEAWDWETNPVKTTATILGRRIDGVCVTMYYAVETMPGNPAGNFDVNLLCNKYTGNNVLDCEVDQGTTLNAENIYSILNSTTIRNKKLFGEKAI
ncbi:MAG: hypothetical protein V1494_03235 [Candidatus Diapherotrites archaeon]